MTSTRRRLALTLLSAIVTGALATAINLATSWMTDVLAWAVAVGLTLATAAVTYQLNAESTTAPRVEPEQPPAAAVPNAPSIHQEARNIVAEQVVQIGEVHGNIEMR